MKPGQATAAPSALSAGLAPLRARWATMTPRERHLSLLAAAAVGILLVWWIAIAPALATLAKADTRRSLLDAQQQRMLALQAEAQRLQAQPKLGYEESLRALQTAVQQGLRGNAQLNVTGDRAVVTVRGVPADTLASWLGQVRANAHAVPVEARLTRSSTAPSGADGPVYTRQPALAGVTPPPDYTQNAPVAPAAAAAKATASPEARWDGTLVLALPSR